jgi:hypothetical membrane protein
MELNPLKFPLSCLAAPACIVIFCAFLTLSIGRFPQGFSPFDNWISDLGNTSLNPEGAAIFNAGCMIAGVPVAAFFLGLYRWYTDELWRNLFIGGAQVAGVASGVALIMVGYYPELYSGEHYAWSAAFFVSLFIALLLASATLFSHRRHSTAVAAIGLIASAVVAVFIAAQLAGVEFPAFEWLSVALAMAWTIAVAIDTYLTFT